MFEQLIEMVRPWWDALMEWELANPVDRWWVFLPIAVAAILLVFVLIVLLISVVSKVLAVLRGSRFLIAFGVWPNGVWPTKEDKAARQAVLSRIEMKLQDQAVDLSLSFIAEVDCERKCRNSSGKDAKETRVLLRELYWMRKVVALRKWLWESACSLAKACGYNVSTDFKDHLKGK
jgi:hypothetical protein